jgi:S-methylmethionine-dependent homocysteine/selenocysteine methylase
VTGVADPLESRLVRLHRRLADGRIAIMDGGMGTGLQAKGVPMDGEAWSGVANLTHPEAVRALHAEFLTAGAEILITNTFAAGPGPLAAAGYGDRFEEANRNAVAAAREACAAVGREAVIAGSMSRMVADGHSAYEAADESMLDDAYRRQAAILGEAGVDVIVLEMMGALRHARPAVTAAAETGLPVWLGISIAGAAAGKAETVDGEDVATLLGSVPGAAIDAVFVMHTDLRSVPSALGAVRATWGGTVGAYPHVGDWRPPNWVFHEITPTAFAEHASEWAACGAAIVGGCCGIGPEHIAELARLAPGLEARS